MSVPARLQAVIEALYRLQGSPAVVDFCIDERFLARAVGQESARQTRESLVVHNDGEYTDLALYLASGILERTKRELSDPSGELRDLDAICAVTEGVSHFVYFTFCGAALDRPVSQIELELQAEIDKFLILRGIVKAEGTELLERLFERFELDASLGAEQRERYLVANRRARRYARWLDRAFRRGDGEAAMRDARLLYRKPLSAKLDHISRAA